MQNWLNNPEVSARNKEALEIFNEAARVGMDYSIRLWEKQAEVTRAAAGRAMTRAMSGGAALTPESAAKLGKEAGEAELSEFQRAAREYCDIAAEAGEALMGVAEKGRTTLARNFGEAAAKGATVGMMNGQASSAADMVQKTVNTANEMFANGLQFAYKAMQTGMDGVKDSMSAAEEVAGSGAKPSSRGKRSRG